MDCSDMSELFTGRHVGQWESGDMSRAVRKRGPDRLNHSPSILKTARRSVPASSQPRPRGGEAGFDGFKNNFQPLVEGGERALDGVE
jgi:hypothetical protein